MSARSRVGGLHLECFVTDHLHANPRRLTKEALAHLSADPTLDAPPRAAIWAMLMGLLALASVCCAGFSLHRQQVPPRARSINRSITHSSLIAYPSRVRLDEAVADFARQR